MLSIWFLAPLLGLAAGVRTKEQLDSPKTNVPDYAAERARYFDGVYFCENVGYAAPCGWTNVRYQLNKCQRLKGSTYYKNILSFAVIDKTIECGLYEGDDCDVNKIFPLINDEDDPMGCWDLGILDPDLLDDPWGNRTASFKCTYRKDIGDPKD